MKKSFILSALGLALIMVACGESKKEEAKVNQDSIKLVEMTEQYDQATNFNDSLLLLMGDIYAGLDSINMQEGLLVTPGIGDNADKRAEIKENLSLIRQRLQNNKQLLAELEKKAQAAAAEATAKGEAVSKVLQQTIDKLKVRITEQDAKIEQLVQQLEQANTTITTLQTTVEDQKEQIADVTQQKEEAEAQVVATENEANKVYYVMGSDKQLKEYGVLTKKFLGSTKIMQGENINYNCFKAADKRTLTSIPTNAKKVEIKSLNDPGSYRIDGEKDGPKTIVITNPDLFWQKTPYLVIQTKN